MIKRISILIFQLLILFSLGGGLYMGVEILWRGHTHGSMGVLGGLCFVIIGLLNEGYNWSMPLWKQVLIGSTTITSLELVFGVVLNIILKLNIWDYSNVPLNFLGQICLPYFFAWCLLTLLAIFLDDYVRYILFNEEKPKYHWK